MLSKGDWSIRDGDGEGDFCEALDKLVEFVVQHCLCSPPPAPKGLLSEGEAFGEIECFVEYVRHLPRMDFDSSTDSFFMAYFDGLMICESKPKFNTYDPVFGEAFRFRCAAGKSLKISFFDHDVSSDADLIGSVTLLPHVLSDIMQECSGMKRDLRITKTFVLCAKGAVIPEGHAHHASGGGKQDKNAEPAQKPGKKDVAKKPDKKGGKGGKGKAKAPPPVKKTHAIGDGNIVHDVEGFDGMKSTATLSFRFVPRGAHVDLSLTQGRWY